MAMIVALTSEIAVLRARLDSFERLNGAAGGISSDQIDAFVPDAAAEGERTAQRQKLLRRVFRVLSEAGTQAQDQPA